MKTEQINAVREAMQAKKQKGLESGEWFNQVEENKDIEIFGTVTRKFSYDYEGEPRAAVSIRLLTSCEFTQIEDTKSGKTKKVTVKAGELINLSLSGQLKYCMDDAGVQPGTIVMLEYNGKDMEKKIKGNHPHVWTTAFYEPDAEAN